MLLIENAGRMSQNFAEDVDFRRKYKHVESCKTHELATVIREMEFSPPIEEEDES